MGHFTITLPDNRQADVRHGTVRKINSLLDLLPWRKTNREEKRGYIVTVDAGLGAHNTYQVFKTLEGQWLPQQNDEMMTTIKVAIDTYEKEKQ